LHQVRRFDELPAVDHYAPPFTVAHVEDDLAFT